MTARLIVRVDIDDIPTRSILDGSWGETIAGEHPGELRGQLGIVVPQMAELLIARCNEFHSLTVVVVQHTVVIIDLNHILTFGIDHHRDGIAYRGIPREL